MRTLVSTFFVATLSCGSAMLLAQQQSPAPSTSPQSQDVPHQEPGTDSPDLGKQRVPTPKQNPGQTNPNDVPHQQPGTDSPDLGKQRVPKPNTNSTGTSSKKTKRKKNSATTQTSS